MPAVSCAEPRASSPSSASGCKDPASRKPVTLRKTSSESSSSCRLTMRISKGRCCRSHHLAQGVGRRAMSAAGIEKDEVESSSSVRLCHAAQVSWQKTDRFTHVFHGCHRTVAVPRLQVEVYDAGRHADLYFPPRPTADAARQPLARAALDPRLDAVRHARRRWLAVVRHGPGDPAVGRRPAIPRGWRRDTGGGSGNRGLFLHLKKATGRQRPCAFEPHCWATLLPPDQFSFPSGHTITAFAVAVSLSMFLSGAARRPVLLRGQRGGVAHPAGHALSERRAGGRGHRHGAGVWIHLADAMVGIEPEGRKKVAHGASRICVNLRRPYALKLKRRRLRCGSARTLVIASQLSRTVERSWGVRSAAPTCL